VELVRAGFHGYVEDAAAHLPIFRGKVAGLNRNLLNGVDTGLRLGRNTRRAGVRGVLALNPEGLRVPGSPIDSNQRIGYERGPWNQLHYGVRIANAGASGKRSANSQYGELIQALSGYVMAQLAAFRLEQRGRFGDGDGIGGSPHLQDDVDSQRLRDLNRQTRAGVFLETGHGNVDFIAADRQLRQRVVSRGRGCALVNHASFHVPRLDRRIGDHRAGRIGNGSGDGSAVALGERAHTYHETENESREDFHDQSPLARDRRLNGCQSTPTRCGGQGCRIAGLPAPVLAESRPGETVQ